MPQGISSAPEEYQRRQNEALAGLNGVEVIADDILCYGSGESMEEALADHDRNLVNLLKRARSVNLKFNKNKLRLKLDQVTCMVQLFTSEGLKPDPKSKQLQACLDLMIREQSNVFWNVLIICPGSCHRSQKCLNYYASYRGN